MNELTFHLTDTAFLPVIADGEVTLQRLLGNMVEKDSFSGSLTIKVDIELTPVSVPNFDPSVRGDTRQVLIPKLSHKVSSVMQIKDETKGGSQYDDYELTFDKALGEYVLKPIVAAQQSVFDFDGATESEEAENAENMPEATPSEVTDTEGDPAKYLLRFVGADLRVCEAVGNYTVRANRGGSGSHTVLLSSAFAPSDPFHCPAGTLKEHVGHHVVCVGRVPEHDTRLHVCVECRDCEETLFDIAPATDSPENADENQEAESGGHAGDEEPEDISDMLDDYPYDAPME